MNIFVSWSGERSRRLAERLCEWLRDVLQYTKPWVSGETSAGRRWSQEVADRLQATNYGILCLTPENVNSPWILFEAGGLAKDWQSARVVPLLFGGLQPSDLSDPLTQFQAKQASRMGLAELIQDINIWSGTYSLKPDIAARQFERCWPEFWPIIEEIAPNRSENHLGRAVFPNCRLDANIVDKLVTDLIQTVARAIILPRTPDEARVGASVFELRNDKLVCIHHWSPNQSERLVNRLSFAVSSEIAGEVMVVRSILNERIEKGPVNSLIVNRKGISGDVPETLLYVISAPIFDAAGKVQWAWGFDTSAEIGETILKYEISDAVMHQVGEFISNLFTLNNPIDTV